MFRAERLLRITIQTPEHQISAVTGSIAKLKLIHLIRVDETHLGRLGYVAETDGALIEEYDMLRRAIEKTLDRIAASRDYPALTEHVFPEKEIYQIRERFNQIRAVLETEMEQLAASEIRVRDMNQLSDRLKMLPGELDFTALNACHFVCWVIGLIPATGFEKLDESLSRCHHALIELGNLQDRSVVLILGLKKEWDAIRRALQGALYDPLELPGVTAGTVDDVLAGVTDDIARLRKEITELGGRREIYQHRFGLELLLLREKSVAARRLLEARRLFGKIDKSFIISGWIPVRLFERLSEELTRSTAGQVVVEKTAPEDLREVREGIVHIPILFNNPMLVRPFENLTSLFGTPRYHEVEPTIFFALSFLLLFGMMFGDVGQGGVLFTLGHIVFRRSYKFVDYGIILMECGISSALFGFLYGSVFGIESLLPALWFRPMDNISYFIKVTLSLGVALVSLGLALNLINAVRLKEYDSLPGAGGLAGAVLYWMAAGLGVKYLLTGQVAAFELRVLGWSAAVLLLVMVLHRPLYRIVVKKEHARHIVSQSGFATNLVESVVEVFDDLLRFVTSTVSFLRVAAFALSHAALFTAVFSIARVVAQEQEKGVSYWVVVAAGNMIIILLEGLVVSIQTVRLEYYEFFGKFFRGGGQAFRPLEKEIGSGDGKP